ncbi:MAG: dihydrolipoyllysine-residue acetyltransferase [Oceanospirillaceae bacterium]|nr:dihydrolipoyllysine-residue acetyltransferase [Oceanospirillaceae bacterium]
MTMQNVTVPDLGGIEQVEVIEISVAVGDRVAAEDTLIVVESDKASMDIPSPAAGIIRSIDVKKGDKVSTGSVVLSLEISADTPAQVAAVQAQNQIVNPQITDAVSPVAPAVNTGASEQICVPDLGGMSQVSVIELVAKEGDSLNAEASLIVLESDKASMDVPAPRAGVLLRYLVKVGDKVNSGTPIAEMRFSAAEKISAAQPAVAVAQKPVQSAAQSAPAADKVITAAAALNASDNLPSGKDVHAGPAVRMLARELGVDLTQVKGSGPRNRILKEDLQAFVKQKMQQPAAAAGGFALPELPAEDFSRFGPVESKALSKIKLATARNMRISWLTIPQVTQFDEADITALEEYRKGPMAAMLPADVKVTPLAFITKACVKALQAFPAFNSSLSADGQSLIYKGYYHVGIAVDTPDGLVVPVIKDADKKSVTDIARESSLLAAKARDKKLPLDAMAGASFTISSLGGIGGTAFTPIVNAPQVAILGVSKASIKPVWDGKQFAPRLMLPLSVSYDHRVVDGAEAARFTRYLAELLSDVRHLLL